MSRLASSRVERINFIRVAVQLCGNLLRLRELSWHADGATVMMATALTVNQAAR